MMNLLKKIAVLSFALALMACGDDSGSKASNGSNNGPQTGTERGGPQSLSGFTWSSEPVESGGIEFQLDFEFTQNEIEASNTCDGATTVSTSAPVRYTYRADIAQGNSDRVEDGDSFCEVEITDQGFDFEIVGGDLQMTSGGETLVVSPSGAVRGLYGDWSVATEIGTLTFSMGNGRVQAVNDCTNGLTASTSVAADFTNFLVIEEDAMGGDDACFVQISAGTFEYRFEGDDLILSMGGQDTRFSK